MGLAKDRSWKNLAGAQLVPTVDDGDLVDNAREVPSLVEGSVAAAYNDDVLAAEEVAVADGAVGDTATGEFVLAGYAELLVGAAGGDDYGLAGVGALGGVDEFIGADPGSRHPQLLHSAFPRRIFWSAAPSLRIVPVP